MLLSHLNQISEGCEKIVLAFELFEVSKVKSPESFDSEELLLNPTMF